MGYGIITLLPALLVIVVAIKSKRTTEALLIGCVSSYLIIAAANKSNPVTLMVDSFFKVVTDYDTVWLLIVCGLFGSLIAVINAARGTHAIANWEKFVKQVKVHYLRHGYWELLFLLMII